MGATGYGASRSWDSLLKGFATFSKMEMQLSPFLVCNFRYFYYATNTQEQPVVIETISNVEQTNVTGNTTLIINRCKNQCGSAISLNVRVDNFQTYTLTNGSAISINVSEGNHTIHYEQIGGVGKKKRTGFYNISVFDNKTNRVNLMFTSKGLSITEGSHA